LFLHNTRTGTLLALRVHKTSAFRLWHGITYVYWMWTFSPAVFVFFMCSCVIQIKWNLIWKISSAHEVVRCHEVTQMKFGYWILGWQRVDDCGSTTSYLQ
jgi:hypothetical protein